MAILTVSSCIPHSLRHGKENSSVSRGKKKKLARSIQASPSHCLVWHVPSFSAVLQACVSMYTLVRLYPLHALSISPVALSSPPVHKEPQKNLEQRGLWRLTGPCIFPLLYASASIYWERSKKVNKSCCTVNFGLGTFYRGGLRAVPSFTITTCVNVGKSTTLPVHK